MSARLLQLCALLAAGLCHAGFAAETGPETFAPKSYKIQRYEQIWKRSPFIVETVAVTSSPGLASKYSLVGIVSLGNKPIVFLVDRNDNDPIKNRFTVSQGTPDARHNIELVSVSMNGDPRKSSATIRQGSEQADLLFDATTLPPTGPVANAAGAVQGVPIPIPTRPQNLQSVIPAPPAARTITPQSSSSTVGRIGAPPVPAPPARGTLSNPSQPVGVIPANPAGTTPPTPTRRIIRPNTINVK